MDGGGGKLLERSACWPMCGDLVDWQSDGGDGAWFLPPNEEVTESGYCMEMDGLQDNDTQKQVCKKSLEDKRSQ